MNGRIESFIESDSYSVWQVWQHCSENFLSLHILKVFISRQNFALSWQDDVSLPSRRGDTRIWGWRKSSSWTDCYGPPCRDWPMALEDDYPSPLQPVQEDDFLHPQILVSPLRDGRDTSSCQDKAKFCRLIKTFKMCSDKKFSEQCCQTCHTE
jgi:hypothetical protein